MTNYHEKESIALKANKKIGRRDLHLYLVRRGFKSVDDFYELLRSQGVKRWQSSAIMSLFVLNSGKMVYETEEDIEEAAGAVWDELECEYLLATLPIECIDLLIVELRGLCETFNLQVNYSAASLSLEELRRKLVAIADELSSSVDVPGSETLRILIYQSYNKH